MKKILSRMLIFALIVNISVFVSFADEAMPLTPITIENIPGEAKSEIPEVVDAVIGLNYPVQWFDSIEFENDALILEGEINNSITTEIIAMKDANDNIKLIITEGNSVNTIILDEINSIEVEQLEVGNEVNANPPPSSGGVWVTKCNHTFSLQIKQNTAYAVIYASIAQKCGDTLPGAIAAIAAVIYGSGTAKWNIVISNCYKSTNSSKKKTAIRVTRNGTLKLNKTFYN